MTTRLNSYRDVSTVNQGRIPQEDDVLEIPSLRPGPEARNSVHVTEGSRKAGAQLGGSLPHHRSGRQAVVHLS